MFTHDRFKESISYGLTRNTSSQIEHYGIRGIAVDLLQSYLTDRKQFVYINGINCTSKPITVGVSQGSILGPLFYTIYAMIFIML